MDLVHRRRVALAAIASASVALAGSSLAAEASAVSFGFEAEASDGYSATVVATDDIDPAMDVALSSDAEGLATETHYGVEAKITGKKHKRISADYGELGRISVKFRPQGKRRKLGDPPPGCRSTGKVQPGNFKGTISFVAESGFASFTMRSVKGFSFGPHAPYTCGDQRRSGVVLRTLRNGAQDNLEAFKASPDAGAELTATSSTRIAAGGPRIEVGRELTLVAPASAFTYAADLSAAMIAPPPPFTGSGSYAKGGQGTFAGDLAVQFPGAAAPVVLAPADSASLAED